MLLSCLDGRWLDVRYSTGDPLLSVQHWLGLVGVPG